MARPSRASDSRRSSCRPSPAQDPDDSDDAALSQLESDTIHNTYMNASQSRSLTREASSLMTDSVQAGNSHDANHRTHPSSSENFDETSPLLDPSQRDYRALHIPKPRLSRFAFSSYDSRVNTPRQRHISRRASFSTQLSRAFGDRFSAGPRDALQSSKSSLHYDDRVWYDQFTSTDWVRDTIADAVRIKRLRDRADFRGRLIAFVDRAHGWIIVSIIGIVTALVAYTIDVTEATIFDYKQGYCQRKWYFGRRRCCGGLGTCDDWKRWSHLISNVPSGPTIDFIAYIVWMVGLTSIAFWLTIQTRTTILSPVALSTLDENLGAPVDQDNHDSRRENDGKSGSAPPIQHGTTARRRPPFIYYPAAGSGVAEVKVIMSGFVLHGYLGVQTLVFKTLGLVFAASSGLSLGKEGPYVHLAACVGNITCRLFEKYRDNAGKRREMISAAAAAGLAVAFGSPIAGVLFSLEEVSYYFPSKTLFRTFFCTIAAALSLKFFNPYGTGKIVLFEIRYFSDWKIFELIVFVLLGVLGGILGALFIKASRVFARSFRQTDLIKKNPFIEVIIVALITGLVSYWNRYTRLPVAELLYELASPCASFSASGDSLCATTDRIPNVILHLAVAFVLKAVLTIITFGIKVPAGIYVPAMVVGGLVGRVVGHSIQLLALHCPHLGLFSACPADGNPESCVVPGVYALVAAGATMCGVTRLSLTLAVILFELTGSLEHVLPFSLGVLAAKWTADALEPLSIYDLLTEINSYPYLGAKTRPIFSGDLGDITPPFHTSGYVDLSVSCVVPASQLRAKLDCLQMAGEIDGGVPLLRNGILVGLISAPDLEYALDEIDDEEHTLCHMDPHHRWPIMNQSLESLAASLAEEELQSSMSSAEQLRQRHGDRMHSIDFTSYVDPAPVALDLSSPLDLVFDCFVKLGLRYVCVLSDGRFVGMVHKKAFVRHVRRETKAHH